MGRKIGYARISMNKQELNMQLDALHKEGCESKLIFKDKLSGARKERPGLDSCIKTLEAGDTLVVWRLDRLARSLKHLVYIIEDLRERRVGFKSIRDGMFDTGTASGRMMMQMVGSFAEFERSLIQERTKAGLEAARARGRKGGRKPLPINDPRVVRAKKLHADKSLSISYICKDLKVTKTTLYRWLEK